MCIVLFIAVSRHWYFPWHKPPPQFSAWRRHNSSARHSLLLSNLNLFSQTSNHQTFYATPVEKSRSVILVSLANWSIRSLIPLWAHQHIWVWVSALMFDLVLNDITARTNTRSSIYRKIRCMVSWHLLDRASPWSFPVFRIRRLRLWSFRPGKHPLTRPSRIALSGNIVGPIVHEQGEEGEAEEQGC